MKSKPSGFRIIITRFLPILLLLITGCTDDKLDEKIDFVNRYADLKQLASSGKINSDDEGLLVSFLGFSSPKGPLWDSTMTYRQALEKAHRDIESIRNGLEFVLTSSQVVDTSSQDRVAIQFQGKIVNHLKEAVKRMQIGMNVVDFRHGPIQGRSNSEIETLLPPGATTEIPPFTLSVEGLAEQPIYRRELIELVPESLTISMHIFDFTLESGELVADFGNGNNVKHLSEKYLAPVFEELVASQKTYLDAWILRNLELLKSIGSTPDEGLHLGIKGFQLPSKPTPIDETANRRAQNIGIYILSNPMLKNFEQVDFSKVKIVDIDAIVKKESLEPLSDVEEDFKSIAFGRIQ